MVSSSSWYDQGTSHHASRISARGVAFCKYRTPGANAAKGADEGLRRRLVGAGARPLTVRWAGFDKEVCTHFPRHPLPLSMTKAGEASRAPFAPRDGGR